MKKIAILLGLAVFLTVSCVENECVEKDQESCISNISSTPCLQSELRSSNPASKVDIEFTDKGVQITYYNFEVTCDFTTVNVTHTFVNGVLRITQKGSPNQADCVCYSDVSYTINGLLKNEVNVIFINDRQVYCYNNNTPKEEWVLINGVRWATRNVDAPGTFVANPEDTGMYYQWNRNAGWSATDPMINSNGGAIWDNSIPTGTVWEKDNDPSPVGYRVPTLIEIQSLLNTDKVKNEPITIGGVIGRKFTDRISDKSIFLPAVGYRISTVGSLNLVGTNGCYWSRTQNGSNDMLAYYLFFGNDGAEWRNYAYRSGGQSVRPVADY